MSDLRVGIGYDIHPLKKGRALWLGGVQIAHHMGLDGHSDADVLLHAIIDAVLGAAGLPDIGSYFPPGETATSGISSAKMLTQAVLEMERLGYRVVNVDSVLIAEEPRVSPHRESMRKVIGQLLKIPPSCVQVKGKTNEGLDALGKRQAIAAQAVVLLERKS